MQGVNLREAQLQEAKLQEAKLPGADLMRAQLQGVNLMRAQLPGVNLREAQLQGVNLMRAQLPGADLREAQLQGVNLIAAQLQGADLQEAKLQGAKLALAELQGANLAEAQLQGANLRKAQLQGANLAEAQLQGANLAEAQLQWANLARAQLQGADLIAAQLQGSSGKPGSWDLAWMLNVSFDFSNLCERHQYLEELLSDEMKDIKLVWRGDVTLERYLRQLFRDDSKRGALGGAKPDDTDLVFHRRKGANWPEAPDVLSDDYWDTWAKWVSEFACENEYTARSSLQFLSSSRFPDTPVRQGSSSFLFFLRKKGVYDLARKKVRKALSYARARGDPECAGLRDLSENEWQEFVDG